MKRVLIFVASLCVSAVAGGEGPSDVEVERRVGTVCGMPGFVAFWDFVLRDPSTGQFAAHQPDGSAHDFRLEATNYVRDYWGEGRAASYDDFPLLNRGPFGQAIRIRRESDDSFRPCLLVPRERLHDTGLDVKGPDASVSMVAWIVRESGNHAVAGIWHEGTDLRSSKGPILRVEGGRRQYCIFAGLAANDGGSAVHVSENGGKSFGDKYARNLAVTPETIPAVPADAAAERLDAAWSVVGFTFDNAADTVTAYLDGRASEYWIEEPASDRFFKWPANGWLQAELRRQPGLQEGEDPDFPADQFYEPPEGDPEKVELIREKGDERVELRHFPFTRVHVTVGRDSDGNFTVVKSRELVALKVNPFWFPHDLYSPRSADEGGPFTIGRVIHTGRSVGFTGWIGGVAVFDAALSAAQMAELAEIGE